MCFHDNNKSAKSLGLSALRLHFRETTCPHGHITTAQPPEETSVQGSQNKRPAVIKWQDNNVRTFSYLPDAPQIFWNILSYLLLVFISSLSLRISSILEPWESTPHSRQIFRMAWTCNWYSLHLTYLLTTLTPETKLHSIFHLPTTCWEDRELWIPWCSHHKLLVLIEQELRTRLSSKQLFCTGH